MDESRWRLLDLLRDNCPDLLREAIIDMDENSMPDEMPSLYLRTSSLNLDDLNALQNSATDLLHLAVLEHIQNNHVDIIRNALLEGHLDINTALFQGSESAEGIDFDETLFFEENLTGFVKGGTPLIAAVLLDRPDVVDMLIAMRCNVDAEDSNNSTALLYASRHGRTEIVNKLLIAGSNINHTSSCYNTPLLCAIGGGHVEVTRSLLAAHGIDLDMVYPTGSTAVARWTYGGDTLIMCAIESQHCTPEIINLLVNAGCDVNHSTWDDKTALINAIFSNFNAEIIRALIECGADVNAVDRNGYTPLMKIAQGYEEEGMVERDEYEELEEMKRLIAIRILLDAGSNVNLKNNDMRTALHFALAEYNHGDYYFDVIRMLIEGDADLNSRDINNGTPFMNAVSDIRAEAEHIQYMLDRGADTTVVSNGGWTVLMNAVGGSVDFNTDSKVQLLLQHGIGDTINQASSHGRTALHFAAFDWDISAATIQMMLDSGADASLVSNTGETPLMQAVCGSDDNIDKIVLLLRNDNGDVNAKNRDGKAALHLAIQHGYVNSVRALLTEKNILIDMGECRRAASDSRRTVVEEAQQCLREVAVLVIQRHWRECYYNPNYVICRKRLMEEGEELEGVVKRLRSNE